VLFDVSRFQMSQLASFMFLRDSDVPFLGFWSKPKPRWFRSPENLFDQYLKPRVLREYVCDEDGLYVALCFGWIAREDRAFERNQDPVAQTLNRNLGGAQWIVRPDDRRFFGNVRNGVSPSLWQELVHTLAPDLDAELNPEAFERASRYVVAKVDELNDREALLVSVG